MLNRAVRQLAITMAAAAVASLANAEGYKFRSLTIEGQPGVSAAAVSNRGVVVGAVVAGDAGNGAAIWKRGQPTLLADLGPSGSRPYAINDRGQVAGYSIDDIEARAVVWNGTVPTILRAPVGSGQAPMTATAINDRGQAAGNTFPYNELQSQAVKWVGTVGVFLDRLGANVSVASGINNSGDVVGYIEGPNGSGTREPVVWHGTKPTILGVLLPTICCNQASAINDAGQVVGWSSLDGRGTIRAILWNGDTTPVVLKPLSSADRALAINNRQKVVGAMNVGGFTSAVMWDLATGDGVDLNTFLSAREREAGWVLFDALGINDDGVIVGTAFNWGTGRFSAYELSPR